MASREQPRSNSPPATSTGEGITGRLDSWKEIASYLSRSEKTVRRWEEREGLPVYRQLHEKRGSVYAYAAELESWWESRKSCNGVSADSPNQQQRHDPEREMFVAETTKQGDLETVDRIPVTESMATQDAPGSRAEPSRWRQVAAIISVLLLMIGILAVVNRGSLRDAILRSTPMRFYSSVPLTSYAGSEICPSFAPDGERVAFAWNGEKQDNFDIYVKQIGEGTLLRLTSDPKPDLSPAWSPDGRTIAFLRLNSDEKGEILLMPSVAAGPARSLAAVTAPLTLYPQSKFIAWSPDGKWLVVSDAPSYGGVMGLFLLSVETGEKRRITLPPNEYDDVDPAFSLDMRHLAFARYTGAAGASSDLYVVNLSVGLEPEGPPERLTFYNRHLASPVWASDGRSILFTRTELAGNHSIWRIHLSGARKIEPLPISADSSTALDLSRRGRRLVYTREISNTNVWAVDLPPPKSRSRWSSDPKPWMGTVGGGNPQFSPDGQRVAFQSDSSGTGEIWICDRDGSHARQLTHMGAIVSGFARWSPDGKNIVFHSRPKGLASLYVISAEGGAAHRLDAGEVDDVSPSWSHDGKWIYFTSRETGEVQVWKIPASGGSRIQVTKRGGYVPLESADSQYLYYCTPQNALWRVPLAGGEAAEVLPAVAALGSAYALGKKGIYFIRPTDQGSGQELAFLRLATGQISSIVTIPRSVTFGLALSPDERLILYSQRDHVGSDLMLVENFH
jgi:Tol biopolymer transport system component